MRCGLRLYPSTPLLENLEQLMVPPLANDGAGAGSEMRNM